MERLGSAEREEYTVGHALFCDEDIFRDGRTNVPAKALAYFLPTAVRTITDLWDIATVIKERQ